MHKRKSERAELRRILMNGASIQMFAPRRIGKTWLMRHLAEDLRKEGWTTILIDVEGMRGEDEILRALCRKIEEATEATDRVRTHLVQRLKQLLTDGWQGSPLQAIGKIDFASFSEALIAALDHNGGNTVIMVDEIALFVAARIAEDPKAAHAFLYQLRRLRQDYPKVRWLFTGSIGLDVVARRGGLLGALVDLKPFVLEPFDDAAARSYLGWLCERGDVRTPFTLDDDAFAFLEQELGWLAPFYLQSVADRIRPSRAGGLATRADIERAFDELLRPEFRTLFSPFEEHIEKNFPKPEARRLSVLLDAACEHTEGETVDTLFARLSKVEPDVEARTLADALTALATAGILMEANGRCGFRSGLLRRYWRKYHCL